MWGCVRRLSAWSMTTGPERMWSDTCTASMSIRIIFSATRTVWVPGWLHLTTAVMLSHPFPNVLISGADSVVVEMDLEPDLLDRIFFLAEKYSKKVYAVVSNMGIAMERRGLLRKTACIVCNVQEAGMLFSEDYTGVSAEELRIILSDRIERSGIPRMIITLGEDGAVYAETGGNSGICCSTKVDVLDTTGAGDAFFAGVTIGLTYGKTLAESCEIGTRLACSVIVTRESVCPRFLPEEFGLPEPS